ncbi:hypothetical protein RvY_17199 [Ramazzottius varieornatus]|uniref:F-box domain-containing protein n=1 Tax=Ramazzottius varieornatus TaxID=947166 RepID=A0A1D1W1B2_RAMVA|nr:hypothetical protein RvY_17199 [Ramazzottius varieornatus]
MSLQWRSFPGIPAFFDEDDPLFQQLLKEAETRLPPEATSEPKAKKLKKSQPRRKKKDEPLFSLYTLDELWRKSSILLIKNILSYLDLRNSCKLSRVSTSWKKILEKTVILNRGVVFLDWRIPAAGQRRMDAALSGSSSWLKLFKPINFQGIKHFVCLGPALNFAIFEEYEKLFGFQQSLSKVTFCSDTFTDAKLLEIASFLLTEFEQVTFVNCRITTNDPEFHFDKQFRSAVWVDYQGNHPRSIKWDLEVVIPRLVFDENFNKLRGEEEQQAWLYNRYDEMDLIFPYGKEQMDWLDHALDCLSGGQIDAVKHADKKFLEWRPDYYKSKMRNSGVRTEATTAPRDLDMLDLAFLGRLLVKMNKAKKIRGLRPPPEPFPDDFNVRIDF